MRWKLMCVKILIRTKLILRTDQTRDQDFFKGDGGWGCDNLKKIPNGISITGW